MKILCRERDKYGTRPAVSYMLPGQADEKTIRSLMLRTRFNPELVYYATRLDEKHTDKEILAMFKNRKMRKEPYFTQIV